MKTNDGIERLRADARSLFISTATIDDTLSWATPRQIDAIGRMLRCELDNRDTAKRERLLRRARFPVMKTLDGYDYTRAHARLFCFNVFSAGSSVFFRSVGGWFSPVSSSCSQ